MLRGELVGLRVRRDEDVPVLHAELEEDVPTRSRANSGPWRPTPLGESSFRPHPPIDSEAIFSVVELATDELAGAALLWGIDTHNRIGHLGMTLRPAFRGRGLSVDTLRVLCHYGFAIRGMHRLQLETLADNAPMRRAAERAGFVHEGTLSEAAWVEGRFHDEVIYGRLADRTG
jgi:RimJ/RimL family protein N-acetyltransferase